MKFMTTLSVLFRRMFFLADSFHRHPPIGRSPDHKSLDHGSTDHRSPVHKSPNQVSADDDSPNHNSSSHKSHDHNLPDHNSPAKSVHNSPDQIKRIDREQGGMSEMIRMDHGKSQSMPIKGSKDLDGLNRMKRTSWESYTIAGRCRRVARSAKQSSIQCSLARSKLFGPGSDYGRAIWSTQGGYEPVGSCGRAMSLGYQFGLGFDMTRCCWTCLDVSGNLQDPTVLFSLILSETKDTRPKQRDLPMRTEDPSQKGRIWDQIHKGTIWFMGTSRQRLRVAKGHELPKVVRYQRMQVTKRYEIPRVASIKGYEDQRVPMTKGCIVIPRMQCIVIQDLRSCRDPRDDGLSSLVVGSCFMTMVRWPSTSMDSHVAGDLMSFVNPEYGLGTIACKAKGFRIVHEPWELFDAETKIKTNKRLNELNVGMSQEGAEVKSQGRSGQMMTHQFQVMQKDFGLCMSQERPDVYPYPFKDFSKVTYVCGDGWLNDKLSSKSNSSQWRTDELMSSVDVAKVPTGSGSIEVIDNAMKDVMGRPSWSLPGLNKRHHSLRIHMYRIGLDQYGE
ncbi:hypothetical protein DY000_02045541 [Brassica cretica]|uniref:Uncharacterized protein n=1 Tax=Brassica cretica TaxID=69181 RepID=A0ABQ7EVR9_BRACR|nr:hypothetical protein DY000_02045541 [Brassica cretica]